MPDWIGLLLAGGCMAAIIFGSKWIKKNGLPWKKKE